MRVETILRGRTLKTVTVADVTTETDADIAALAIPAAGESFARLQDWRVERYTLTPDRVNVFLYTD